MLTKKARLIGSVLVLFSILLSLNAFAQDYQRWKLPEGALMRLGKGEIFQIAYSPDGSRLAVAGSVGIWLFDGRDGTELGLFTGHLYGAISLAYSQNGATLASGGGGKIRLWDARTGELKKTIGDYRHGPSSLAISPDGNTIAGGAWQDLRLWDVRTGQLKHTLKGHKSQIDSVAFTWDGGTLVSGGERVIRLWDVRTGEALRTLEGHRGTVHSVVFSPDGRTLASGAYGQTIRLWDAHTWVHKRTLEGHSGNVHSVAFSPDGDTLASASWGAIRLWDVATGELERSLEGHTGWVWSVAFSTDGDTLASSGNWFDDTLRFWDIRTGALKKTVEGYGLIFSVDFSPDGSALAIGDNAIQLRDARTGELIRKFEPDAQEYGSHRSVSFVTFSPNGALIASGNGDETISLWDTHTGELSHTLEGHTRSVSSVAFSPVGGMIASGGYWEDNTVRLWDTRSGEPLRILKGHTSAVLTVAVSPDGLTIASGSRDKTIRLWDSRTGEHKHTLEGHTHDIWSLAFSPDGGTLASGGEDHTIRLWDTRTGDLVQTLDYTSSVSSVAFLLDDFMLASGGGMIRLWSLRTGEVLHTLEGGEVVFSSDWSTLASGSSDGSVLLWDISPYTSLILTRVADVNGDGIVSILDLVLVAAEFGQLGGDGADINGDGVVNLLDLELIAGAFGNAAASPPSRAGRREALTVEDIRAWLVDAAELESTNPTVQRGIFALERLLTALSQSPSLPLETALLPNYPNPFNPETWIPYQLKEAADVTLTIHGVTGREVRTLAVGYQPAGQYQSRDRAAYWDGRNERGELVATGIYFYTLSAGDFSATRRMLVGK